MVHANNHGAKRSGKTILAYDLFIQKLLHMRQITDKLPIDTPQYILAGATLGKDSTKHFDLIDQQIRQ